jgi:hypothetical protein
MIVLVIDIGSIVEYHRLSFLFIIWECEWPQQDIQNRLMFSGYPTDKKWLMQNAVPKMHINTYMVANLY